MSTDELRICAQRVLIAWDYTVLPKSRDPLMQERMGDLRSSLEAQPQSEPVALTDDVLKRLWCECKSIDNWEFCVEYGRGVLAAQAGKGNT